MKYYIATPEGRTEGPFHPETLEVLARRKSITFETLICREGGNEWIKYGEFLSSATHEKSNSSKMNICAESEKNPEKQLFSKRSIRSVPVGGYRLLCTGYNYSSYTFVLRERPEYFRRFHFPCACPIWAGMDWGCSYYFPLGANYREHEQEAVTHCKLSVGCPYEGVNRAKYEQVRTIMKKTRFR